MTVWSTLYATGLFGIPYTVATTTLHRLGAEYQGFPPNGILFSLGQPKTLRDVLGAAGWADIEAAVDNRTLYLPPDPAAAAKMTVAAGPVQALLEPTRDRSGRGGGRVGGGLRPSPERVGNRATGGLHRGGRTTSLTKLRAPRFPVGGFVGLC